MAGSCKLGNWNVLPDPCWTKSAWAVYTAVPTHPWGTRSQTPGDGTKPVRTMLFPTMKPNRIRHRDEKQQLIIKQNI